MWSIRKSRARSPSRPSPLQGIVRQENRSVDSFEAFIDGAGYRETKRNIKADGITIKVDPLPTKPSNFSGGVGSFNISGQLTKAEVKAGEPVTLRIVIGGTGNLKLIQQPKADFPQSFDKYDTKVTDKTRLTDNGIEGNIVYDHPGRAPQGGRLHDPAGLASPILT